jgi:hypothetical protein
MEIFKGFLKNGKSGKRQVENEVDFHQPFCLNLKGFNSQNPQKPGRNLAKNRAER